MGIIQRFTMCLLATLAALIILVNSEEEMENEYSHDLRPRISESETPNYNQPWRAMEAEPIMSQGKIEDWDNKSSDEIPKRRRPGRKRKRRPQATPEDFVPQERLVYPEDPPRPYFDVDTNGPRQTTEIGNKRRRKPDARPIRWTDESEDYEKPFRRSQRRKRPLLEPWPELSEFNSYRPEDNLQEHKTGPSRQKKTQHSGNENEREHFVFRDLDKESELSEKRISEIKALEREPEKPYDLDEDSIVTNDKSLSEFSAEMTAVQKSKLSENDGDGNVDVKYKYREKMSGTLKSYEKAKETSFDSPITLKDILKKSNGTSLSEILQRHNLSLTDLLRGKHNAVSILETPGALNNKVKKSENNVHNTMTSNKENEEKELENSETKYVTEPTITTTLKEYLISTEDIQEETNKNKRDDINETTTTSKPLDDNIPKMVTKRRFPLGMRKKLRIRPMLNNTFKAQLSRDLVTLNSRKYAHHRRNMTKYKEWKNVIPTMLLNSTNINSTHSEPAVVEELPLQTTTSATEEVTTILNIDDSKVLIDFDVEHDGKLDDIKMDGIEVTSSSTTKTPIEIDTNNADRPTIVSMARPTAISSGLRQQAFNNRLKRKRMKNKNPTTEAPQDDIIKHLLGMGNLVSSSEFIARTQEPRPVTTDNNKDGFTTVQDFVTTESNYNTETGHNRYVHTQSHRPLTTPKSIQTTTEEIAKIEIEEIFNDTRTSAKLSKILMERNMTLSELVEHRERGSSHVHLADIFHNASREPNPPEPFLSKSVIEPISKETYPLRAILEANLHDPTAKASTNDPNMTELSKVNIPVVMDYRNNVNENGENMGIMSLFNNFTKVKDKAVLKKDSEGRPYKTSIIPVNITNTNKTRDPMRESRILNEHFDDVVSWNEIFSLMRENHNNESGSLNNGQESSQRKSPKNIRLDTDADGDGVIILEDLQHLKDFESNIATGSHEKLEVKAFDKADDSLHATGILETIPSQTKSVTVATASIAGLAMILFLLTYAVFKWREQKSNIRKKRSFSVDRIPTPVFEHRKGHKNHSSMRSISPMIQTSNIYTLNTLDSNTGKESPEYMWDTLRKPFQ